MSLDFKQVGLGVKKATLTKNQDGYLKSTNGYSRLSMF